MKVVLLSGGSGSRLWPVSTKNCPKQFLDLFKEHESMLTKTFNAVKKTFDDIYIASLEEYKDIIYTQINENVNVITEPNKIGTFGAILNVASYLKYKENAAEDEFVAIVPTDHDVESDFYKTLLDAEDLLKKQNSDICLIGITPTFPSTHYGYILYDKFKVKKFCEKPNQETANTLINSNALWNSGIIVCRIKYLVELSQKYLQYKTYKEFYDNYVALPKNSFDKEVLEKQKNISIIKSNFSWSDLGTWEILANKISTPDKFNTNIINFEDKKIINNGIEDCIIVNSQDGILLIKKQK